MSVALTGGRQHHDLRRRAGLHEDSGLCRPEDGFRGRVLQEVSPGAEVTTDARLWHTWLRINRVLRVMLHTRWREIGERMTSLADLEAFVHDHRAHGGMTGDATEPSWDGYRLTGGCACGVVLSGG